MARKWNSTSPRDADALAWALARCATARDLPTLQDRILESLEAAWGYRSATFFLVNMRPERIRVHAGSIRGLDPASLAAYVERFAPSDVFTSPHAKRLLRQHGIVGFEELVDSLEPHEERYVTSFMVPFGIEAQLTARVATNLPLDGVLSIMSSKCGAFEQRDRDVLAALSTIVAAQVRALLLSKPAASESSPLSTRERAVAELVAHGYDNAAIARRLDVGIDTIKKHVGASFRKLGVTNRTQLALCLREESVPDQRR